jgi:ADP-heptose:LPS heptosyltransferase
MRILLVRLRLLGDVALTTPVIRAVRRRFPNAHVSYLVEPAAAPIVAGNPHLNEVIVTPRRSGFARITDDLALARQLRRGRFDVAIDLHGGPRACWLTWLSRAPMRIGYTIAGRSWMYTHVVHRAPDLAPRHSVLNQADLLRPLGIETCDPVEEPMEMADDFAARVRVHDRLTAAGIGGDDPIAVMHVSAGNRFRFWPALSSTAAELVARHPRLRVFTVAGPADREAAVAVVQDARRKAGGASARIIDADFDLFELRELIARSAVYIGVDSGPAHVAATTNAPIVELIGPTRPERSRPWRDPRWFTAMLDSGPLPCRPCDQRQCAPGDFRCLTGITTEQVAAAAGRAIQSWREQSYPLVTRA